VLDDHVQAMLRFDGGARGMLWASQVASGASNALRLRVYGTRASLHFDQEQPEQLWLAPRGEPARLLRRGLPPQTQTQPGDQRVPAGHPEGYLEAFAQLYRGFAQAWRGHGSADFPGLADGLEGMAFIEAVLRSHQQNAGWVRME
jgi:predicted dehydrogenase